MKHFKIHWPFWILSCIVLLTASCEKNPDTSKPYILPDFKNSSVNTIKNKLEFPSGLSGVINISSSKSFYKKSSQSIVNGVFIEGPRFQNLYSLGGIQLTQNPKISKYELDLDQLSADSFPLDYLTTQLIAEIDFSKYPSDFDSFGYYGWWIVLGKPDSVWRARNLLLDNCLINNDSILTSSNSSDKIFVTNSKGVTKVYLESPELKGITDFVYGRNKKIYATLAPVLDQGDPKKVLVPKRVVSIRGQSVSTEFDLPTSIGSEFLKYSSNLNYWLGSPCLEQIRIIENSEAGKKRFGIDYYVADLLGNVIYKIDNNKKTSVLANNLRYPTSIAVDSAGNLFYTSSPLFNLYGPQLARINIRESLYVINPETGEAKFICDFGTNVFEDYEMKPGSGLYIDYNKIGCQLPLDLNITNILYETENRLYFLITNTRLGNIYLIKMDK